MAQYESISQTSFEQAHWTPAQTKAKKNSIMLPLLAIHNFSLNLC